MLGIISHISTGAAPCDLLRPPASNREPSWDVPLEEEEEVRRVMNIHMLQSDAPSEGFILSEDERALDVTRKWLGRH